MTIAEIIAAFSVPLAKALADLVAIGERNPDVAPVSAEVRRLLESAAAAPSQSVMAALAELKGLLDAGSGPVSHDPVDLS